MQLLLLSNSTNYGGQYLEHAKAAIAEHFADARTIAFVPYAMGDLDGYTATARAFFATLDIEVVGSHTWEDPAGALATVDGVFIGGGNTFRLLKTLQDTGMDAALRDRVRDGLTYMGASAGTNMVCPTIRTTNDMPIVEPPSFEALGLIDFQINPHYLDPDPTLQHMGETREERLAQYFEENQRPVLGLREGSWLHLSESRLELAGGPSARLFTAGQPPQELAQGDIRASLGASTA